jgi:NOL1/NOP2/sun family putative RNA methylase
VDGLPDFFQVEDGPRAVSFTFEHWLGLLYVQQASTGLAAPALAPRPGEKVLDLCAAPGGKTTHIAELMGEEGALVASEINEGRIRGLLGNVYRLGHANVLVVAGDGRDFPEEARFDRVLVDAPCSGEGTLRRRGGSPPNQSRAFLRYVTGVQEALLRKAIRVTRPGGTVLYVTCTFAPEENEAVVSRVLADEPVELEPLELPVPHARGLTTFEGLRFDGRLEGAARVYPHHLDSGGLFLARLRRSPSSEPADAARGWGPVPVVFPGDAMEGSWAEELVRVGVSTVREHFGVDSGAFDGRSWLVRGGRLWLHGARAWPVGAWSPGDWRVVSLGLRAIEFDTRSRPRPTNDLLQWLDRSVTASAQDVGDAELGRLLAGESVPRPEEMRGLQALRYRGRVVGRGVPGTEGLRSEISRARARDLESCSGGVPPSRRPR